MSSKIQHHKISWT